MNRSAWPWVVVAGIFWVAAFLTPEADFPLHRNLSLVAAIGFVVLGSVVLCWLAYTAAVPSGIRVLASVDLTIALTVAYCALDFPMTSLMILGATCPAVHGLLSRRLWGWWWAMLLHVGLLGTGLVAYGGTALHLWAEMAKPPGHMQLISPGAALAILTLLVACYLGLTALPLLYLRRRTVRAAYRMAREANKDRDVAADSKASPIAR